MEKYVIGIDVGGTNIKMMIMNDSLHVLEKRVFPTNAQIGPSGYEAVAKQMTQTLEEMFAMHDVRDPQVLTVAMGLPGMVDALHKRTLNLPYLQWNGFNPAQKVAEHFRAVSVIENDANVNALGECYFGAHCAENMVLITLGTGVGGGIIVEGKIFAGSAHYGGELGHMIIMADGGVSFCGRPGCLEAYCSGSALEINAKSMMEKHPETILHAYTKQNGGVYDNAMVTKGCHVGDDVCLRLMRQFNHYLAVGITNLIELFNPALILLGGGVSNAGDLILKPVTEEVGRLVLCQEQVCPIRRASLGSEAGMYGACALAAQCAGLDMRLRSEAMRAL